jgi:signal transduction histidine kinase
MYMAILSELNVYKKCHEYRVSLWACPQFLFIVMGVVIIASILMTNAMAQRYTEPEVSALIAIGVTVLLLIIGHAIIDSFERVAEDSRAKSEFIGIVSHELRNPLVAIGWQLDLLNKKEISRDMAEAASNIRMESVKMLGLVNDLLMVNRLEGKILDLAPESFSLKELTEGSIKTYESAAKKKNSIITLDAGDDLPQIYADKKKTKMMVEHYIDNAIKYNKDGGSVVVTITRRGSDIAIAVSDKGMGIPEADKKHIFEKFFRAHNTQRYQIEGIGLGLYIVRMMAEKSGGKVGFTSKEGEGSTFWFSLPTKA